MSFKEVRLIYVDPDSDGKCVSPDCDTELKWQRRFCQKCQKKRAQYFRRKYYEDKGWDTSKLDKEQ